MKLPYLLLITSIGSGVIGYGVSQTLSSPEQTTTANGSSDEQPNDDDYLSSDTFATTEESPHQDVVFTSDSAGSNIVERELNRYGYSLSNLDKMQWNDFIGQKSLDYWAKDLRAQLTLLNLAISENNTKLIERLLSRKMTIDAAPTHDDFPLMVAAENANLVNFRLIVDHIQNLNSPNYQNIVKLIQRSNDLSLGKSKIDYLFNSGYLFDDMYLHILPQLSFTDNLEDSILANTLVTIDPNSKRRENGPILLAEMIQNGANDQMVRALLPDLNISTLDTSARKSLLISSLSSKRIQDPATITALIDKGLDVNIPDDRMPSILAISVVLLNRVDNDNEFEIQKEKFTALVNSGAKLTDSEKKKSHLANLFNSLKIPEEQKQQISSALGL